MTNKRGPGRPKLASTERKEVFPMRFSAEELRLFQHAASDKPLREWIKEALIAAVAEIAMKEKDPKLTERMAAYYEKMHPEIFEEKEAKG